MRETRQYKKPLEEETTKNKKNGDKHRGDCVICQSCDSPANPRDDHEYNIASFIQETALFV